MSDLSDLPPLERIQRYLDRAEAARALATNSTGELRRSQILIAEHWERLASDTAKEMCPGYAAGAARDPVRRGVWLRLVE